MSNSSFEILKALNTQLKTVATLPTIVLLEDTSDDTIPSATDTFVSAHLMPSGVSSPTVAGGYEVDDGIYQVSVFTPRKRNAFAAQKLADDIKQVFGRSELLAAGTGKLQFQKVEIGANPSEEGAHYMIPVSVYWRCVG